MRPLVTKKTVPKSRPIVEGGVVYLSSYDVVFDAVEDPHVKSLPKAVRERVPHLHEELAQGPEQVIPEIIALIEQFPHVPLFKNFLSAAHAQAGNLPASEDAVRSAFDKHPRDLFALTNYADLCRRKGEADDIPEILGGKFDLQQLYPERRWFHAGEFAAFTGVVGLYLCDVGKRDLARQIHAVMNRLVPEHPTTELLGTELLPKTFKRLFGWRLRR